MRSREGKEEILGKGKYFLCGGGGREVKKREKYGEKEKNVEEEKHGDGKGGKYLEKGNIWSVEGNK